MLEKLEMLKPGRIEYNKPVAIIYNPNSGKLKDLKPLI